MSDPFVDPGEPGELKGSLRAKDLINKPLIVRPVAEREETGQDGKPWHYVECDVVVLGVGGIEDHASGVRVSWVRVIPQLTDRLGAWVTGTPKVQQDNSVVLVPFGEKGREVARQVWPQVERLFTSDGSAPGEEPF